MKVFISSASLPKRRTKPIISTLPDSSAAFFISSASKRFIAIGFSHRTLAPHLSAAIAAFLCSAFQVQTETASSFSLASISL